jgi:hypothetical protein
MPFRRPLAAVAVLAVVALAPGSALAGKTTECAKVGVCHCVNDEPKAEIEGKVEGPRPAIAEQRETGHVGKCAP